jgi:DNA-binding FrmR family transcriptional regulator
MIDPVSVFAAACTAYNGVKKAVEFGRELEDVVGQMSSWWGAAAQLRDHEAQVTNPPLFRKLLHSGSVEAQALEELVHNANFF